MNKLKICLVGVVFAISHSATAQTMTFGDIDLKAGQTDTLRISLSTETPIVAWQMKFYLPKGLSIAKDASGSNWQCTFPEAYAGDFLYGIDPSANEEIYEDRHFTFICFPKERNKSILGENQELCIITFKADADYNEEDAVLVRDIHLSHRTAKNVEMGQVSIVQETTGIQDTRIEQTSEQMYTLSGQPVNGTPRKGLYIRGGKKIIIK